MKKVIGLWLDHQEAVIVLVTDTGRDTRRIRSHLENDSGFSDKAPGLNAGDAYHQRFVNQLNQYYDNVIASIREAGFILIFGQGDAPAELGARMEAADLGGRILLTETVDKMTESQIGSRAQQRFQSLNSPPPKEGPIEWILVAPVDSKFQHCWIKECCYGSQITRWQFAL